MNRHRTDQDTEKLSIFQQRHGQLKLAGVPWFRRKIDIRIPGVPWLSSLVPMGFRLRRMNTEETEVEKERNGWMHGCMDRKGEKKERRKSSNTCN